MTQSIRSAFTAAICEFATHSLALVAHAATVAPVCGVVVLGIVGNGTVQMAYARAVSSRFDERRGTVLTVELLAGGQAIRTGTVC